MHALTVHVATGQHDGLHDLDFGLELLLDELERLLEREVSPDRSAAQRD